MSKIKPNFIEVTDLSDNEEKQLPFNHSTNTPTCTCGKSITNIPKDDDILICNHCQKQFELLY